MRDKWALLCCLSLFSILVIANAHATVGDADDDGIPDENDWCPATTNLAGPIPTETLCPGCLGDDATINGCNASEILACKPDEDEGERKYGLAPGTQDVFQQRIGWAQDCPRSALGTIAESEDLHLEVDDGSLTIPAGALPAGLTVTLSKQDVSELDPPPNTAGEKPVTSVFNVTFSGAERATTPFVIELSVPNSLQGLYGLIRTQGGFTTEGLQDSGWNLGLGEIESERSVISFYFAATATQISLVVVEPTKNVNVASRESGFASFASAFLTFIKKTVGIAEAQAQTSSIGARPMFANLLSRGWAVVCRQSNFTDDASGACAAGSPEMQRLGNLAYSSAKTLSNLGFENAYLLVASLDTLTAASGLEFEIVDPEGVSSASQEYFVLVLRPTITDSDGTPLNGSYLWPTAEMLVKLNAEGHTVIHELFHAVQRELLWGVWALDWIVEGTATAVGTLASDYTGPSGKDFRRGGEWRDWKEILSANDREVAYGVAEFWLLLDEDLSQLKQLLTSISDQFDQGLIDSTNAYAAVDQALQASGQLGLVDGYLDLIRDRSNSSEYFDLNCPSDPEIDPFLPLCDGNQCTLSEEGADFTVLSMAALCYDVVVVFTDPPCPDPEKELQLIGDPLIHRFFVDGQDYEPGQSADVGDFFKLFVVNIDTESVSKPPPDAVIVAKCPADGGDGSIALRRQIYTASGTVAVYGSPDYPDYAESKSVIVDSWEDGSNESTRREYRVLYSLDGDIHEDTTTSIEPIGEGGFGMGLELALDGDKDTSASVQTQITTTTTSDDTSFSVNGHSDSVATTEGGPFPGPVPTARGGNHLKAWFIAENNTDLELTWGCEMATVQVTRIHPITGSAISSVFSLSSTRFGAPNPDWHCDPQVLPLGIGAFEVFIQTGHGGDFSIRLVEQE